MFIAFEGLDGSGSSTHSRNLADRLERNGHPTLITKEPTGNTPIGKVIRDVLQHKWEASPEGLQLLFCADRAEHLRNVIGPAIRGNQIVITDRYFFSTLAYGAMEVDMNWLKELNRHFQIPDITFLLKADPELCINRIAGRGSDFELFEQHEKLKKIWENYEIISKEFDNIHIVNSGRNIKEVDDDIWEIISKKI